MHAMTIDDAYHVENVLAEGPAGVTERVSIDGTGPFVRKKIPKELANRRVWAALADCTCSRLPQVALSYEMPNHFIVVYDFVPGDTLEQVMALCERLSQADAVALVREISEAAADLHAHGIVHCDIAPANIVVAADGAHLIDFGIAQALGGDTVQDSKTHPAPLGTWGFAAPEQYGFAQVDKRTDVYALARLLGYLLTGVLPDDSSYERALADTELVSPALCEVIERGSAFEPSARYQTASAFAQAVQQAFTSAGSSGAAGANAYCGDDASASRRDADNAGVAEGGGNEGAPRGNKGRAGEDAYGAHRAAEKRKRRRHFIVAGAIVLVGCICAVAFWLTAGGVDVEGEGGSENEDRTANVVAAENSSETEGKETGLLESESEGVPENEEGTDGGDVNTPALGLATTEEVAEARESLTVAESGWWMEDNSVEYVVALHNKSSGLAVWLPSVKVVGRAEDGSVLFTDEGVLSDIYPGQTLYYRGFESCGQVPATVDFSVVPPDETSVFRAEGKSAVFSVSQLKKVSGSYGRVSFTGEVVCEDAGDCRSNYSEIAVTVLLRDADGGIVLAETTFTDWPEQGQASAFEVSCSAVPPYATAEAYVQPW